MSILLSPAHVKFRFSLRPLSPSIYGATGSEAIGAAMPRSLAAAAQWHLAEPGAISAMKAVPTGFA
jgi:hypothetical protein